MKTRTTITGLFAMLARPMLDAYAAERSAWGRTVASATGTPEPAVALAVEIVTPEPTPVAIPAPIEVAVVLPAIVETTTPVSPAPAPATMTTTATKKTRSPRKPSPVMASAARTTTKRTRTKPALEAVRPVEAKPEATEDDSPSVFGTPFTVRMCDTKADSGWSITYTPITAPGPTVGVLEITSKRSHAKYSVMEFPTGWEGRGFTLAKLQGGTDSDNRDYSVFCSNRGPEADSCDCKGSDRFGHCKHRNALRALLLNDKL